METKLRYQSRQLQPYCALNTLVDIALTLEATKIKKNDHSYSAKKNGKHKTVATTPRMISSSVSGQKGPEDWAIFDSKTTTTSLSKFDKSNLTHSDRPCEYLDKSPNLVNRPIIICNEQNIGISDIGNYSDLTSNGKADHTYVFDCNTLHKTLDKSTPDHTYASGTSSCKKFRSADVECKTINNQKKFLSEEKIKRNLSERNFCSLNDYGNKKCASAGHINETFSSSQDIGESGRYTLPRVRNRHSGQAINRGVKKLSVNDHTYARHNITELNNLESTGRISPTLHFEHNYGRLSNELIYKPFCLNKDSDDINMSQNNMPNSQHNSYELNVEDFTLLNLGHSSRDHTYSGKASSV